MRRGSEERERERDRQTGEDRERWRGETDSPKHISFIITNSLYGPPSWPIFIIFYTVITCSTHRNNRVMGSTITHTLSSLSPSPFSLSPPPPLSVCVYVRACVRACVCL